jgi:hypothetical protein
MALLLDRTRCQARRYHPKFDRHLRLHGIDPYTYLVDVLQRVSDHPASRVSELTPRLWKQRFVANPMRSEIDDFPV